MSNLPEPNLPEPTEAPKASEPLKALVAPSAIPGFSSAPAFDLLQRQAQMMSKSDLVPEPYKGNVANCAIALEIAHRVGCSPLMVTQNLDVIKGRPGWRGQYVIAAVNAHPRFKSSVEYIYGGKEHTDSWSCYAQAERTDGKMVKGPTVSIGMAKAEGWAQKPGSKWQNLPELMLGYRAAAFFGRLHVPEILMGMLTTEELIDIGEQVKAANKRQIVERFVPQKPPCDHAAGSVERITPSDVPDEPPVMEDVCAGCGESWKTVVEGGTRG